MLKGRLVQAVDLYNELARVGARFDDPDAFSHVAFLCGFFRFSMRDPIGAIRWYQIGLNKPGHDLKLRGQLLVFLNQSEIFAGNLAKASQQAGEIVNPTFRMLIAYFQGDWKAAREGLQTALDWAQQIGTKYQELNTLSYGVDLMRATGDYAGAAAAHERALSFYQPDDQFWDVRLRPQGVMLCFDTGQPEKAAQHLEYCRKILAQQEDWLGTAGPMWRAEALVAGLQGRLEESDRYFQKSIAIFKQYSLPWHEAETLHYWGKVLIQVGRPDRAREKLDAAIKIYRDYGAGHAWIDRVEVGRRRAQPSSTDPPQSRHVDAETASRRAVFRHETDFWTISYLDRSIRLKDMRGLHYIAYLLGRPNERFHVRELSARVGGDAFSPPTSDPSLHADREDAAPILDAKAKADYRARRSELRVELDEAERMNDTGRAERIRRELEFVDDELSAAVGLSGRDRKISDLAERTRVRIGKAIRSALRGIRQHDPSLAHHLTTCIRTGYYCAYLPGPGQLPSWKL
jgi:tetratricopeptide (TPR) repeat protein